jgi:RimJ/RimL family protein N-acetyltransferase
MPERVTDQHENAGEDGHEEDQWRGKDRPMSETGGTEPGVTLSDGRVTLRPWSRDDAGFLAAASADPAIRRYNGGHDREGRPASPLSVLDAEAAIDQFALGWQALATTGTPREVAFAITDARTGEPVGCCGVDDWTAEDVAQFGYWIAPDARGRGYATRAVVLLTRWLFELGAARVFLTIIAGNVESLAVARRAGFVHEGTMRDHSVWQGERYDVMWFAALPLEWTG